MRNVLTIYFDTDDPDHARGLCDAIDAIAPYIVDNVTSYLEELD